MEDDVEAVVNAFEDDLRMRRQLWSQYLAEKTTSTSQTEIYDTILKVGAAQKEGALGQLCRDYIGRKMKGTVRRKYHTCNFLDIEHTDASLNTMFNNMVYLRPLRQWVYWCEKSSTHNILMDHFPEPCAQMIVDALPDKKLSRDEQYKYATEFLCDVLKDYRRPPDERWSPWSIRYMPEVRLYTDLTSVQTALIQGSSPVKVTWQMTFHIGLVEVYICYSGDNARTGKAEQSAFIRNYIEPKFPAIIRALQRLHRETIIRAGRNSFYMMDGI